MSRRVTILSAVAAVALLSGCKDRGECLETQTVHHDGYYYMDSSALAMNMPPTMKYKPPRDTVHCVRWEFPEGRPK